MSGIKHYSYKGRGKVYLQRRVVGAPLLPIGNCSKLDFAVSEETEEMLDYQDAGGGVLESSTIIKSVNASLTCQNLSPANIALALRGASTARAAAAIAAEPHTVAVLDSLILFARLQDMTAPLTVKSADEVTTYTENTDYTRVRSGIIPLADGAIAVDDVIKVSYAALSDNIIQALTASADDYRLVFDGLNDAKSAKPVRVIAHLVGFSPSKSLGLITDKFADLELEAVLKKDESITGAGLSKFFTVEVAEI
jgi:hypothetical protein